MQLVSDRRYRFAIEPDAVWSALGRTGQYQRWWPWLRTFEAGGLIAGERWRCAVRPPLPYTLRFAIHLDEVVAPLLVAAHVTGDIAGTARVEVTPSTDGSEVRLSSTLSPSSRAFALLATVARPVVRRGHDWVLDTGAGQFAAHAVGHENDRSRRPRPAASTSD